jgi:two-component system, LytTR family, response regulator
MATATITSRVEDSPDTGEIVREYSKKLVIRSQNRIFLQPVEAIDYMDAAANYVNIHAAGQIFRIRSTIGALEQKLDPSKFGRIHRCTILNLDRVVELRGLQRGDYLVILNDGTELKMSRRHRRQVAKITAAACATGRHLVKYANAGKQQDGIAAPDTLNRRGPALS